jgi:hypothetical protein
MPVAQSPAHYINSSKGCPMPFYHGIFSACCFFSSVRHRHGIAGGATPLRYSFPRFVFIGCASAENKSDTLLAFALSVSLGSALSLSLSVQLARSLSLSLGSALSLSLSLSFSLGSARSLSFSLSRFSSLSTSLSLSLTHTHTHSDASELASSQPILQAKWFPTVLHHEFIVFPFILLNIFVILQPLASPYTYLP